MAKGRGTNVAKGRGRRRGKGRGRGRGSGRGRGRDGVRVGVEPRLGIRFGVGFGFGSAGRPRAKRYSSKLPYRAGAYHWPATSEVENQRVSEKPRGSASAQSEGAGNET